MKMSAWLNLNRPMPPGSTLIKQEAVTQAQTLHKVVPKGDAVKDFSPYWMSAQEAKAVGRMTFKQAGNCLALRLQEAGAALLNNGFETFPISVKSGQAATVFTSKVAPAERGGLKATGGATQTLVPGRGTADSQWTAPVKVDPKTLRPITGG